MSRSDWSETSGPEIRGFFAHKSSFQKPLVSYCIYPGSRCRHFSVNDETRYKRWCLDFKGIGMIIFRCRIPSNTSQIVTWWLGGGFKTCFVILTPKKIGNDPVWRLEPLFSNEMGSGVRMGNCFFLPQGPYSYIFGVTTPGTRKTIYKGY